MQVTRGWWLLKCRGFTYQDQASTGPTELIEKSAASCMPWVRPVLVNPISHKQVLQNNNTRLAAQGHYEANGGRRLYFISFLKTSSCLLLSASIFFYLPRTFLSIYSAFSPIYFSAVICQYFLVPPSHFAVSSFKEAVIQG